jgi:hypothetical protein
MTTIKINLVDLGWAQVHIISADARIQPDIMLIKVKQVRSSSLGLLKGAE